METSESEVVCRQLEAKLGEGGVGTRGVGRCWPLVGSECNTRFLRRQSLEGN